MSSEKLRINPFEIRCEKNKFMVIDTRNGAIMYIGSNMREVFEYVKDQYGKEA